VITGFGDKATKDVYNGVASREARSIPKELWPIARRKLDMINVANELKDLQAPPSNRLERLKGKLSGFWSIRINDQFRVVFRFEPGSASDVEIVDYHR